MTDPLSILLATDWLQFWEQGRWFEGMFRPLVWRLGRAGVVLLLGAPMALALWIQSESLTVPATLLALFAGLMLGNAPPGAAIVGYIIVVVGALVSYRAIPGVGR